MMDKLEELAKQLTNATTYEAKVYEVKLAVISDVHIVKSASTRVTADSIAEVIDVVARHVDEYWDDDLYEITGIERSGSMLIDLRRWNYERKELEKSA